MAMDSAFTAQVVNIFEASSKTEIIEAYFRLASPLLNRVEKQIFLRTTSWRRRMMRGDGDHRA